jgi:TetR/AcrR family transcriptional regulator, regulator of cefoperazone and chloramphenicol sensitivity
LDINEDLRQKLLEVEGIIHGLPAHERLDISLDIMTDYLFEHPEISNLILLRYFGKTREESLLDFQVPELVIDIARSMGLTREKKSIPEHVRMRVLALMNAVHNFVSGEEYFRSMLSMEHQKYISMVKETLKFVLLPAFTGKTIDGQSIEK